jgi:hypothetical protein
MYGANRWQAIARDDLFSAKLGKVTSLRWDKGEYDEDQNRTSLDTIVAWAERAAPIRALVLTGSRAKNERPDRWADYDLVFRFL